jgi:hypothetical protein
LPGTVCFCAIYQMAVWQESRFCCFYEGLSYNVGKFDILLCQPIVNRTMPQWCHNTCTKVVHKSQSCPAFPQVVTMLMQCSGRHSTMRKPAQPLVRIKSFPNRVAMFVLSWKWFRFEKLHVQQTNVLCKVCRKTIATKYGMPSRACWFCPSTPDVIRTRRLKYQNEVWTTIVILG